MSLVGIVGHVAFMFCPGGTRADRLRLYHGQVHEEMNRLRRQFPNRVHVLEMGSSPTSPKYNTCMRWLFIKLGLAPSAFDPDLARNKNKLQRSAFQQQRSSAAASSSSAAA
jgi:hypothetical protein